MLGFFSKKETESTTRPDGKKLSCVSCGLYKGDLEHPKMAPTGNFKKGILNIGEFTTAWDDEKGKPFQSKAARILYSTYKKLGIDLEEDCLNVNSVMCFPYKHDSGKPRNPTAHEIQCCRLNMLRFIKQYKPKLIVVFGAVALESIIGHRWKKGLDKITRWRGFIIPDQEYNAWVAPVFSPTYVSSQESVAVQLIWEQDLTKALNHLNRPFRKFVEPEITILTDLKTLSEIKNLTKCAFDYETTGLKPHAKKHRIVCCSIADSLTHVYVFMLIDKNNKPLKRSKVKPFVNFLINPYIPKVAQNCLHAKSFVHMEDGSKMMISKLVSQQIKGNVLSYNEKKNRVEPKPITNWFKTVDNNVKWFKILTKDSILDQGHSMTPDHKVYIKGKGMTRVDKVEIGDYLLRLKPTLSKIQKQVILASHFGDGTMYLRTKGDNLLKNASFVVSHGDKQKNYLAWKHSLLENVASDIVIKNNNVGFGASCDHEINLHTFTVTSLPVITSLWKEGYVNTKKVATKQMLNRLTPLGIAIWYMDNGSYSKAKYGGSIRLSTEALDMKSVKNIIDYFKNKHKIIFTFNKRKGYDYGYLRVYRKNEVALFFKLIERYIHPDCLYKIATPTKRTSNQINILPAMVKRKQHSYSEVIGVESVNRTDKQRFARFCIEVKDNHNFFTTTGLVNNCSFEENWSFFKFGVRVKGWVHDTMLWTHIFDNRTSITGLKFQAYVCFGIDAYDEDVANYIKAKDANSHNKMIEYVSTARGKQGCLKYCAFDSILELRLAELQEEYYIEQTLPF